MGKIAILFPGQGAQHVGMGRQTAERFPAARTLFERAGTILGYDLAKKCFEGPAAELDRTEIAQPAIFVTSMAAVEMLRAESPAAAANCAMSAGLSVGEYTALVFAGALSFEDGLRVVQKRGEAMQAASDANPSGMVSLLLMDRDKVEAICRDASAEGQIRIANYLCPGNVVLSGAKPACARAAELAQERGGKAVPLAVAGGFHTELMSSAVAPLTEALARVALRQPSFPVYSNVDAKPHHDPAESREILVRQVVSPVLWEETMRNMLAAGADEYYEVGPGKVLRGLMKRIDRKIECLSVNDS